MNEIVSKAHGIFERTALREADVIPETAAMRISKELKGIAFLFQGFLDDGHVAEQSVDYFVKLVAAARLYSELLLIDPLTAIVSDAEEKPVYLWAVELCFDAVRIIRKIDLQPEWKAHYEDQCKRVEYFALILKESPDNLIKSV